jgi:hypothetical protein
MEKIYKFFLLGGLWAFLMADSEKLYADLIDSGPLSVFRVRICKPFKEPRAGTFKESMGARNRGGRGLSYRPARLHTVGWRNSFFGIDSGARYTFKNTGSAYIGCRNWFLRIDSWAFTRLQIRVTTLILWLRALWLDKHWLYYPNKIQTVHKDSR